MFLLARKFFSAKIEPLAASLTLMIVRRVIICFKTFVFKMSQQMPNKAIFTAEEVPEHLNYDNIIIHEF